MRPERRTRGAIVVAIVILVASRSASALPPEKETLLPPRGKTIVMPAAGATPENLDVFRRVTGYTPQGHKVWIDLDDPDHFKLHAAMEPYNGSLMVTLFFGRVKSGGDLSPQSRHLPRVTSGQLDGTIQRLGRELRVYGRPVYLDIGCEAEFFYPKHPKQYVKAYRHVHDKLRPLCPNVLFFWHTVAIWSPGTQVWYPGDRYVDGIGLSLYNDGQFRSAEHFVEYAKRRGMPVAIFDMGLAPHRGSRGFPPSDWSWEGYHARVFRLVDAHDIRLIGYQGNSEEVFREPGPFHHTRLDYLAPEVQRGWSDMLKRSRFQP